MKRQYIQPSSELILLQPVQLIAASPGANDQNDPGMIRELSGFDDSDFEQLLNM